MRTYSLSFTQTTIFLCLFLPKKKMFMRLLNPLFKEAHFLSHVESWISDGPWNYMAPKIESVLHRSGFFGFQSREDSIKSPTVPEHDPGFAIGDQLSTLSTPLMCFFLFFLSWWYYPAIVGNIGSLGYLWNRNMISDIYLLILKYYLWWKKSFTSWYGK